MQSLSSAIRSTQKWVDAVKRYQDLSQLNREVMDLLIKEIRVTKNTAGQDHTELCRSLSANPSVSTEN